MKTIKPTRLYIKIHEKTGLKYFGKSVKKNIENYHGSGKFWKQHIKKHGKEYFKTIWLSDWFFCEEEITKFCSDFCEKNNIVGSSKWANLKEEAGDGGSPGEETRKRISEAGKGRVHSAETKQKMAIADRSSYKRVKPVSNETKEKLSNLLKGKPSRSLGKTWSPEKKLALSQKRMGQSCPTKGMKRVYREDGSFYFAKPIDF
jgi:hypothetical protein